MSSSKSGGDRNKKNESGNAALSSELKKQGIDAQAAMNFFPWRLEEISNEVLGKGAFAVVTAGKLDVNGTKKPVAIKRTRKIGQSMIEIEIMTVVQLTSGTSSRILRLFGFVPDKETLHIVMEKCPNGNLYELIVHLGGLGADLARTYLSHIVEGLSALHLSGYIHRDLKPSNILLDRDFNLKVADFGCSTRMQKTYKEWPGSKGYKAPEIKERMSYDEGVDIWSSGVILFILICGAPPFDSGTFYYELLRTDRKTFWSNHLFHHHFDDGAQDLINRMLMISHKERITLSAIQSNRWYRSRKLNSSMLKARIEGMLGKVTPKESISRRGRSARAMGSPKRIEVNKKGAVRSTLSEKLEAHFPRIPGDVLVDETKVKVHDLRRH